MPLQILKVEPNGQNKAVVVIGSERTAELTGLRAKEAVIAAAGRVISRPGISGSHSLGYIEKDGSGLPDAEYLAGKLPPGGLHLQEYQLQGAF